MALVAIAPKPGNELIDRLSNWLRNELHLAMSKAVSDTLDAIL